MLFVQADLLFKIFYATAHAEVQLIRYSVYITNKCNSLYLGRVLCLVFRILSRPSLKSLQKEHLFFYLFCLTYKLEHSELPNCKMFSC